MHSRRETRLSITCIRRPAVLACVLPAASSAAGSRHFTWETTRQYLAVRVARVFTNFGASDDYLRTEVMPSVLLGRHSQKSKQLQRT